MEGDTIINIDTVASDTVWPDPVINNIPVVIKDPKLVYVDTSYGELRRLNDSIARLNGKIDELLMANQYKDSIYDENITMYYDALIDGHLLDMDLSYKLKVPKTITHTIEKEIIRPVPKSVGGILLHGELGFSQLNQNLNYALGFDYLSSKRWMLGGRYGFQDKSVNLRLGYKLFEFKK